MKRCAWCKQKKSVKEFRKHGPKAAKKYGKYYRICKACSKEHGEVNRKRYEMLAGGYGWCATCHQWKPIDEFHKSTWNTTGITSQCIRCISDNAEKLDRRLAREEMFQKGFKWCAPCAKWKKLEGFSKNKCKKDELATICKQCFNVINDSYFYRNRERILLRSYAYEKTDRGKENKRRYLRKHKDKVNLRTAIRRARRRKAGGYITPSQWESMVEHYCPNGKCLCCHRVSKMEIDHIDPDGNSNPENLQPLCRTCNAKKHNSHKTDYRPDSGEFARSL